jgi:hypothetical protein
MIGRKVENVANESQNNFMKYSANPMAYTCKNWFQKILQNKYSKHEQIITRVASSLVTDSDLDDFGKLIGEVYEMGFNKAVNDYKGVLEEMGLKVKVAPEANPNP